MGLRGHPADKNSVKVMKEIGIDISKHRCSGVEKEDMNWADYALVM